MLLANLRVVPRTAHTARMVRCALVSQLLFLSHRSLVHWITDEFDVGTHPVYCILRIALSPLMSYVFRAC